MAVALCVEVSHYEFLVLRQQIHRSNSVSFFPHDNRSTGNLSHLQSHLLFSQFLFARTLCVQCGFRTAQRSHVYRNIY